MSNDSRLLREHERTTSKQKMMPKRERRQPQDIPVQTQGERDAERFTFGHVSWSRLSLMVPEAVIQLIGPSRLDVSMGEEAANRGVSKLARGFREPEGSYSSLEGRRPRKAFLQGGGVSCFAAQRRGERATTTSEKRMQNAPYSEGGH